MFQRKIAVIFAIISIAAVLGFIIGVAPGYFATSYVLFGLSIGFLLFIFIFLIIIAVTVQYLNKKRIFSTRSLYKNIFHASLSRNEKISLIFIISILFTSGILLGLLCELLLKAISASIVVQLIIAAIFVFILLIALIIILIIASRNPKISKLDHYEQQPTIIESNTNSQVRSQNTTSRINRSRSRPFDDDSKVLWQDSSFNNSMAHSTNTFNTNKPSSTIQKEYQKLLHPSPRFYIHDKVYVNDNDLAQIIEADGSGNYRIRYFDNGMIDFKNGSELRKALPLIN